MPDVTRNFPTEPAPERKPLELDDLVHAIGVLDRVMEERLVADSPLWTHMHWSTLALWAYAYPGISDAVAIVEDHAEVSAKENARPSRVERNVM